MDVVAQEWGADRIVAGARVREWALGGVTSGQQPGTSLRSVFVSH